MLTLPFLRWLLLPLPLCPLPLLYLPFLLLLLPLLYLPFLLLLLPLLYLLLLLPLPLLPLPKCCCRLGHKAGSILVRHWLQPLKLDVGVEPPPY